ncbi:MAG TPA: RNA polymerase sigma factor [Pyrinomonadaceae bacterium]|nr:RNA polymerase sigma factor [Pyrinomonadaceae bacterium]
MTIEDKITELFEALRGSIHSYLVTAFGFATAAEAEDITQDAFLQLHRVLQTGNVIENPRAWLFRVAHNRAINRLKTDQFIAPLDDAGWDEIVARLPDAGQTPEQLMQRAEDFALVHEAMKRLSIKERQCLHLRAEGLRYREIAEILDISAKGVGTYLRRAIKKLMSESNDIHTSIDSIK